MSKKVLFISFILVLLSTTAFAGSLGDFSSAIGGGGGDFVKGCLDGCCSEAAFHGMRAFFYGASQANWYYTYPWYYNRYGRITIHDQSVEQAHTTPFLLHLDYEGRWMPEGNDPGDGEISGYRVNAKMYTRAFMNFGAYYQQLWESIELADDEHQHVWGFYFTFGGWIAENVNIDFGFGLVGLGGSGMSEDVGGVSFNAEGTFMTLPGMMLRYRWSYTWFETNRLIDADISFGYVLFILELRVGFWYMDTSGADPLLGPYAGIALWF